VTTDPMHFEADWEVLYPPGSFFLTTIGGRTGWWVALAQTLVGIPSRWTHAGIIGYSGLTYEAAPGGVHVGSVLDLQSKPHVVCDAPVMESIRGMVLTRDVGAEERFYARVRQRVINEACQLLGRPYSLLDYLALGLWHLGRKRRYDEPVRGFSLASWARERVQYSGHLICSALVDLVYDRANIHLYDDGRLPGDVTPSDLDGWVQAHGHIVTRGGGA
jgi:hypothetical protein